ncbi:uncharacterized protein N7498_004544 [Penicillium cinerascens]|uniref:Uncharacterized protein n=1 Tax=Penicillium cinerascens TaxID=70096 RepID=A0A9W9MM22_9EURO|nr:uncharacterized protein N7498_004544 [Penicillium cinerascens]KAJ5203665.1 hypothetical protein N7498_004544 [Penicillium cinerascens]
MLFFMIGSAGAKPSHFTGSSRELTSAPCGRPGETPAEPSSATMWLITSTRPSIGSVLVSTRSPKAKTHPITVRGSRTGVTPAPRLSPYIYAGVPVIISLVHPRRHQVLFELWPRHELGASIELRRELFSGDDHPRQAT